TLDEATTVQFPGLDGVLPGFGRQEPNDWGLTFELRDDKSPHWTGSSNSPRTFGHFGQSGTFLWVDPELGSACGVLTDKDCGEWDTHCGRHLAEVVAGSQYPSWPDGVRDREHPGEDHVEAVVVLALAHDHGSGRDLLARHRPPELCQRLAGQACEQPDALQLV